MTLTLTVDAVLRARSISFRPTEEEVRELAESMPGAHRTRYGSMNVHTRAQDRARHATFVVTDRPYQQPGQTIGRAEGALIAAVQDAYIQDQDMVVVDGFIGHAGPHRAPARLIVERANANIAGMQRHLYFDPVAGGASFTLELTVVCTPNLGVPGYADGRVVAVWPEDGVTRVVGSDYFGETKKALMRMWSGRVQDARVLASEDGCIEKTYGLDPLLQPVIHAAATGPDAYLENVAQHGGELDFMDRSRTQHGRAVFSLRSIDRFPPGQVPPASVLLILNRDAHVTPAVTRIDPGHAAGQFLLRQVRGPGAAGRQESGGPIKADPLAHEYARQGNRLAELLADHPMEVFLLNTGRVGGQPDGRSKAIAVADTAAIVSAAAEGTITWDADPDGFGQVAAEVPGIDDRELLQPRLLYARQGRTAEYRQRTGDLQHSAAQYLASLPGLDPRIAGFRRVA